MNVKNGWPGLLVLLPLLAGPASTRTGDPAALTISGTSTVRSWSCQVPHSITMAPGSGVADAVLTGQAAVETLSLAVDVGAIDCGNGTMDGHLRKALRASDHPSIQYQLSSYDLARAAEGASVTARGTLTIAGSTQPITMDVTVEQDEAGRLRARGEQQIVMSQFGVKPPSLMLGTMKVGDAVRVSFDVVLED